MLAVKAPAQYGSNQNVVIVPGSNNNTTNNNTTVSSMSDNENEKSTFTSYVRRKRPQQSAPANLNKRGADGIGRQLK